MKTAKAQSRRVQIAYQLGYRDGISGTPLRDDLPLMEVTSYEHGHFHGRTDRNAQ